MRNPIARAVRQLRPAIVPDRRRELVDAARSQEGLDSLEEPRGKQERDTRGFDQ